jgi:uncharacterized protein YdiU (UPF0061 family)
MRSIRRISLVAVCGAALLVTGLGPAVAQSTSSSDFTKQVCAAIVTAKQSGESTSTALKTAAQAYKAAPSPTTAVALRDALTQSAQTLDQQFATLVAAIQQAGTPANATEFVAALSGELATQRALAQRLAQHAAAVDTSSASAFATSFQQVLDETKADAAETRASAKKNPAFKHAPRGLRPIVRVLTTKADTCGKS